MKRLTQKIVALCLAATVLALGGCDLTELNDNPNAATSAEPGELLTNAQLDFGDLYWRDYAGAYWMRYAQFLTTNQYTTADRFGFPSSSSGANNFNFNEAYLILNDLQEVIRLNRNSPGETEAFGAPQNQIAIAKVMKAMVFQYLTDQYGPIPFNSALKGQSEGTFRPEYSSQEEVYNGLLTMLTEASDSIQTGEAALASGDLIYGGSMSDWKKLANAMKMRVAMRMSDVAPDAAETALQEAINAGGFSGSVDFTPALIPFSSSSPHQNPLFGNYNDGRDDWAAPQAMTSIMNDTQDPRRPSYFTDADGDPSNGHQTNGFPYGLPQVEAQPLFTDPDRNFSRPAQKTPLSETPDAPGILFLPDEISFVKAEAALRSDLSVSAISQSPEAIYKNAITASLNYWGVSDQATIDNFYAGLTTPNDGGFSIEQNLGVQKWIAQYLQGIQGWSTWRRLDFQGVLQVPPGNPGESEFGKEIAVRMNYPNDESTLNGDNLDTAINNLLGGDGASDNQGVLLWWDTEYQPPRP